MVERQGDRLCFDSRQNQRDTTRMNAAAKIALPPLDFEEFNALDVLVSGEIAETAYRLYRAQGADDTRHRLLQ